MIPEAFIISSIKPVIDKLMTDTITPKFKSFVGNLSLKYDELLIPKGEHFEEYLYRTYKKYSIINTLILRNEQRLLKDLYVPLTIYKEDYYEEKEEKEKITGCPINLLRKYNKILITDTAGMGKSTLVKRIFLDIIENGYGIPIFIELRRLSRTRSILTEIKEQIDSLNKNFDLDLLYRFIQTGEFIFIFDGYDEISLNDRSNVTSQIQDFISKANNNIFILTSRPEDSLACFGDFQCFKISSLNKGEAYELLRKYDKKGETSKLLISELKTGKYEMINEFLKNPLLVSLLFAAFDYKQTIPLKKHIFYRQVYDAYFDTHDLSKGGGFIHEKMSGLDIDDFNRVLRYVGFSCLKHQKIEFDKDTLLNIINEVKNDCLDLNFSASDFFYDLLKAVPLFCNDGQYYKWVHKSIQEYFAALFIYKDAKENQDAILIAMYKSDNADKYLNLLDIYYDIDNWGFTKNIVKSICEEYCSFYEENKQKSIGMNIDNEDIDHRIGNIFMHDAYILSLEGLMTNKEIGNPFDIIKEKIDDRINIISYYGEGSPFVASYISPCKSLIKLIHNKYPILFKKRTDIIEENLPHVDKGKIHKIDVHSFENNSNEYKKTNFCLDRNEDLMYYFDYHECKKEIQNINLISEKKNKTSTIVYGL